jgi:glycosyltransferase involved in cell wall biosynthesis
MQHNPVISVIIPTHNRKPLLRRALQSVFAQTRPAEEVIVVDDGSGDGTAQMIAGEFPEVRYFFQSNQGVSKARNLGIQQARGNWLALLDSDDQWLPEKLQTQMEYLHRHPGYRLCHTEEIWIRRGKRVNAMNKHQKFGGYIFDKCLPLCVISPSSVMIERGVLDEVGLFDESLPACEDYDLWLRICSRYPVLFVEEPLIVKHGGHDDQLSRRYWGMDRFRIKALQGILQDDALTESDYENAVDMLTEKCRIYIQGALKRGKHQEADAYRKILQRYAGNSLPQAQSTS